MPWEKESPKPAIDLVMHLTHQVERIVEEHGYQMTLPYRFKHPELEDVVPRQVVEADMTVRESRDGDRIVLVRREEESGRDVMGKVAERRDRAGEVWS